MKNHSNKLDNQNTKELQGVKALLISALAFSIMTVCVKQLKGRIPVAEIVFLRALFSLIITRVMLYNKQVNPWGTNRGLLLLRGLLGTIALLCIFKALEFLPLGSATIIQYTYPTYVSLAAWIFLKEKINLQMILSVVIGWIGVLLVVQPNWIIINGMELPIEDVAVAISGALFTALAYICVRKLSKDEHPLVIIHYFPLVSVPLTFPFFISNGVTPLGGEWLWLIGIGVFTQIGQIGITKGLKHLPAARASCISYSQVLFATIWGIIIFSEQINEYLIIGAMLILVASLISINAKLKVI
ncbi:DMT family transporter [Prochlorococcus sp. MIT 1223]|uniref:DMT family transporter n=1 Tax=Prochlorococcus sp. MIT 1223 TaxID=3096217 RepID=UPI002A76277D|nr:DMT family transporter [Prochlorococcus sp. MIT 1223]